MKIEVQHIPAQGAVLSFEKAASYFPSLLHLPQDDDISFIGPIRFDLEIRKESDLVVAAGRLFFNVALTCSRCLAVFEETIEDRFELRFSRRIPEDVHPSGADEIELTAEQIGLVFYKEDVIDLKEPLQEQVILALPFKPLCDPNCRGLCPHCGIDRNKQRCQCDDQKASTPFAVLKDLKLPSQ